MSDLKTERTTLRRLPARGLHDFETIAGILDEAIFCHIAFVADGQPYAIPTAFGREDRKVYIHGSSASRMLGALDGPVSACLTATLIDGLVLARSAFRHSANYRSVVVLGTMEPVEGDEKLRGLKVITNHVVPGRWGDIRPPSPLEMKATAVLKMPIVEASAKIRTGGPNDVEEDYELPTWAGVLPLSLTPGRPVPEARLADGISPPEYAANYRRPNEG
jgi:nitroimidazol reductase NimA-like FMN-containing flavoprotein (pyridoxamine 5'-phosphate oxidase superfamily)